MRQDAVRSSVGTSPSNPSLVLTEHSVEGRLIHHFDTELLGFFELAARARSSDEEICLRAHRARHFRAEGLRESLGLFTGASLERSGEHDGLACQSAGR